MRNVVFPDNILLVAAQEGQEAPFVYLATDKGSQEPTMGSGLTGSRNHFHGASFFLSARHGGVGGRDCVEC